eukprot:47081-Pyramimonas_sp.AAC.1
MRALGIAICVQRLVAAPPPLFFAFTTSLRLSAAPPPEVCRGCIGRRRTSALRPAQGVSVCRPSY